MKKLTKWGAGLVVAIAMMFMAGQAGAVTLGCYETGQLVPQVVHNSANIDTVVGVTCIRTGGCDVYWTFFDNNSTHVTDGMFEMTKDDFHGFSWAQESGLGLEDMDGYLVLTSGNGTAMPTNSDDIHANAFMVDTATKDAIFIPVVPLAGSDYNIGPGDLADLDSNDISSLSNGIPAGAKIDMRYWMDSAYSAETMIVVWTVCDSVGKNTVNMFNDEEDRKSLNFDLENAELNIVDPSTILGRPADFIDGFIRWDLPAGVCTGTEVNDAMVYTYIKSTVFGAQQTLLAGE